ncbi:uncharacterized protein GGS22DRAFT_119063 [Annulohypoxylon maeteangense]|uniref:uncharacterized protein n=1 Tax=Annulohypoxylon maeteangense TaxID=1927788 RepID=UPI002008AA66|nr:uncharacterized protein GGS22DRAFT_119063 [Annulohypoxylon maeteangense]KAI0886924.1 hypothetical protein GGS22DRAFT_119063 [Annulohypoxylon maeteangense]
MASSSGLPVALLIIYLTLSLPTIYIAIKHGLKHGVIIGWFFLFIFCTLKIVSSALELKDATSSGAALVSSIGLSPLLAAICGTLHESRVHLLPKSRRPFDKQYLILFHILVSTAIALVASGASKLSNTTIPPEQMKKNLGLVKGGMVLLLLSWISLAIITLATFQHALSQGSEKLAAVGGGKKLLLAVAFSIPFLGIRVLESMIYFFTQNPLLNPVSGSVGLRVGLQIIEEIIVALSLITAGILTRNIDATAQVDRH